MLVRASVVLAILVGVAPAHAEDPEPAVIDREVRHALRQWDVPGAAVVVVRPDRVLYLKGHGVRELGRGGPVGPDTVFPLASCTKSFTTAALAMLVDDKELAWDDPVRRHLAEFHLSDPHADALVTVRDLLCHRTGVAAHDYLWYRAPWSQEEMVRRIGKVPPGGPFRASFAYQSIMFMAAGQILKRHDAGGWDGFVRRRLLGPLGMTSTFTTSTEAAKKADVSRGHKRRPEGGVEVIDGYPMPEPNPAGSVHTTARDLGRWLQFQLGDGSWQGKRLVSAANLEETHRPQTVIPSNEYTRALSPESVQLSYAMGWVVADYRGVKVLQHAGLIDGFRCQLVLLPDKGFGIGLLNNLHATKMNLALANRLTDLLLELPPRDWHGHYGRVQHAEDRGNAEEARRREETRQHGRKPTLEPAAYRGRYEHPAYGTAEVRLDGGKLVWKWGAFERRLRPFDGDTFEVRDVILEEQDVAFVVRDGRVTRLKALGVDFERAAGPK